LWIPLDRFLHRKIVQFVGEHNAPDHVDRPRGHIVDEQAVIIIDIGRSDVVETNAPVERAMVPDVSVAASEERVNTATLARGGRQQVGVTPVISLMAFS
jgi:hypothetical protein